MNRQAFLSVILALVVISAVVMRIRLIDLPLERDEGEFALMGQMILDGTPPYQDAYNLKPPGIYLAYAAVMALFGQTAAGIHTGLLLVNLGCALLLFLITRKVAGQTVALSSTAAFLTLSLMPKVLGLSAHATHFVLLPALGGIFLLTGRGERAVVDPVGGTGRGKIFYSGVLLGVSVLMKQPGIFFVLFGALVIFRGSGRGSHHVPGGTSGGRAKAVITNLIPYTAGVALPMVTALAWLLFAGVFDRFWFWVVTYAMAYGSEVSVGEGLRIAGSVGWSVLEPSLAIAVVACLGAAALKGAPYAQKYFIVAFLLTAVLGVAMGLHFRRHYFVLTLPAVSILFGLGLDRVETIISRKAGSRRFAPVATGMLALISFGWSFAAGSAVYLAPTPAVASRIMFGPNPFVESQWIADRVEEITAPGERFAVIGSEPQIYFYADRPPATGYLYMYGLVEGRPIAGRMRREMIAEIEARRPGVIVYVNGASSWLLDESSDRSVFSWFGGYVEREGFVRLGIVEIVSPEKTVALVGDEARAYQPVSGEFVELLKRVD